MKCCFCRGKITEIFPATNEKIERKALDYSCSNCGYGIHGPIVECHECGTIYVDDKLSQEVINGYYAVAEDPLYIKQQKARERTFENYLEGIEKETGLKKGRMLDIGTNTGLFLKIARERGWEVHGLEPGKEASDYARKVYGLDVINKPLESYVFPDDYFDVITMWDVIEHFNDPVAVLPVIKKSLKNGGWFVFSTVDPKSLFARVFGSKWSWYMEMHRVFWPRKTAEHFLRKNGFSRTRFSSHWRYLSLGYLALRLVAVNHTISRLVVYLVTKLKLNDLIIPYYANDLYNCYSKN